MADTALFEDEDALTDLDETDDAFEEVDELDALDEAGDELDGLDAAEGLANEFEDALDDDGFEDDDGLDEFGDFAYDEATGLHLPARRALISGPAAVALASRLNPFVLDALDADDADAFFRRIRRGLSRVGRGLGRAGRGLARGARAVGRVAGPLLQRALPMIQRVAGMAGPWGRLVSAGIGAARGLASGRGLRGALAGAVGGLVPGIGGRLASSILRGDGADDDAALDALADMADARQVAPAVALPLGAGLAARAATPRPGGRVTPAVAARARVAERTLLRAANAAGGSAGRRLRVMRTVARVARARVAQAGSPAQAARVLPAATAAAARRVLAAVRRQPQAGTCSPATAQRRLARRRRILATVPLGAAVPRLGPRPIV